MHLTDIPQKYFTGAAVYPGTCSRHSEYTSSILAFELQNGLDGRLKILKLEGPSACSYRVYGIDHRI